MVSALDGITVLDLTQGPAGAIATMFLCDNGARVIRVEPPDSEGLRADPGYKIWDRGKESVVLDIVSEQQTFDKLVSISDALVESYAPSSAYQAIVGYDRLASINPRLVRCSITAYGSEGPLEDEPAQHDLVMARAGVLASQPSFRPGPVHVVHPAASVGAGILAAQGVVASLLSREKTGKGRKVETSLMAGAFVYLPKVVGDTVGMRPFLSVTAGGGPFYSVMECADGEWVQLGCIHGGFVDLAAAVMGIYDIVADPKYGGGRRPQTEELRQELFDIVANVIKSKTFAEWEEIFEDADVPYARASLAEESMSNPQILHNEMVIDIDDPEVGKTTQMGLPIKMWETPGKIKGARAVYGQHTDKVLAEIDGVPSPEPQPASTDSSMFDPPLKGIRVMEITNVIAGPTAGKMFTDLGADVIKFESPDGDISRPAAIPFFLHLNSNKRSFSVNTRTPEGQEIAKKLASQADILLANMRPGATDRMGIGTDALKDINPGIIETHVTAFGWTGPYSHRPGVDPLAQAWTGLQRAQGGPENPPVFLGMLAPTDYTAGGMSVLGTLLALFVKERTGVVQRITTNLLNGGNVLSADGFMKYEGKPPRRLADKGQYGLSALHRLYETEKGWFYLAAESQEEWEALCAALGRDDLASDARFASEAARRDNDTALAGKLTQTFSKGSSEEWFRKLRESEVSCALVAEEYNVGFFSDTQAIANDMIIEHQHPNLGLLKYSRNGLKFHDTSEIISRPTPLLGEHSREMLQELGYSEAQIEELYEKGIVKTEEPSQE